MKFFVFSIFVAFVFHSIDKIFVNDYGSGGTCGFAIPAPSTVVTFIATTVTFNRDVKMKFHTNQLSFT